VASESTLMVMVAVSTGHGTRRPMTESCRNPDAEASRAVSWVLCGELYVVPVRASTSE
jgi:hypothetical protein